MPRQPSIRQTSVEELQEQADEVDYLTPIEYAKLIDVKPQQVYGWIRRGVIASEQCKCGRTIVCVSLANKVLAARRRAREGNVDVRPDAEMDT
jgi:hypothetical protein